MNPYDTTSLHARPEWRIQAARWFQEKWGIPLEEYLTSIDESIRGTDPVPQWYIVTEGERIIAGAGVIANDFHDRKDLTPNVCALYVEPELRRRGIAGHLLKHICRDMAAKGISPLYLITEHTSFYERYGWEYLCMVMGASLFMQERDFANLGYATVYALGSGIGWFIAIVSIAAIREKLAYSNVPKPLKGLGISFIITGLMGIAFMSFMGIQL